jgi:hypothetical protein
MERFTRLAKDGTFWGRSPLFTNRLASIQATLGMIESDRIDFKRADRLSIAGEVTGRPAAVFHLCKPAPG